MTDPLTTYDDDGEWETLFPVDDDHEDHPDDCGCPECKDDADRDTSDEHDYDNELIGLYYDGREEQL